MWEIDYEDKYNTRANKYEKSNPVELEQVFYNLATYLDALNMCGHPRLIKRGFVHIEPKGIIGIDQSGGDRKIKDLKEIRLYIFPFIEKNTVHMLTIGDKNAQSKDIDWCRKIVDKIRRKQ